MEDCCLYKNWKLLLSVKYNLTQLIFRETQGRKFFNRFTIYATAGGGQCMYRSRMYKYAVNGQWYLEKTNSFTTASIDSASATSGGGLITSKTPYSTVGIIPVGAKFHFKLNAIFDCYNNYHLHPKNIR